jgi:hypothetical protein
MMPLTPRFSSRSMSAAPFARSGAIFGASFHRAAEQEVGVLVGERVFCPVGRRPHHRVGRRRRAAAALRIGRPIDAEHRLFLLEQIDHRVQPLPRLRLAGDAENSNDEHQRWAKTATHKKPP